MIKVKPRGQSVHAQACEVATFVSPISFSSPQFTLLGSSVDKSIIGVHNGQKLVTRKTRGARNPQLYVL